MSKKLMSSVMAVVLAAGLMPTPALAAGTQEIAVGSSLGLSTQALATGKSASKLEKKTKKMHSCYKKVLKQGRTGKGKFKSAYSKSTFKKNWNAYYSMYDINKDGTPELFVHAGSYNLDTEWYVYTMKSGKAKYLGKFGTGQMTLGAGKGHKLYGTHVHMFSLGVALVKLKKGKVTTAWKYEAKASNAGLNGLRAYTKKKGIKSLSRVSATNLDVLNSAKVTK